MESHDNSDEGLMRQVALGESSAISVLLRRYASPLLTFIQRTVGQSQRAEDLFQEVFLAVWVWRSRYSYPRPFRPWLFGIAMNKCRADLRRQTNTPKLMDDCPADCPAASDPTPADAAVFRGNGRAGRRSGRQIAPDTTSGRDNASLERVVLCRNRRGHRLWRSHRSFAHVPWACLAPQVSRTAHEMN